MASRGKKSKIQKKEDKVLYAGGIELREGSITFDDPNMTWDKFYDYVVELDRQEEERLQKRKKTNYPINIPSGNGVEG
ncbi:hypothetical protein Z968_11810 [Clostridium novyi A str. 4552]|uniref:Uncharacterized protein n=1 Tax=Clostridium novyi A str. 4552 TaxID=1444289 RepID=A0A0A0I120_CLONO|nr:hypothetical protein [Clostridium novyi]KGM94358.1 hypothetical protein Z968_11810 [Clostridium novyi A str. 4552]